MPGFCCNLGSIVIGHVTHVVRASRKSQGGSLNVAFTRLELPNERTYAMNASLSESASADNEGEVKGKSSKKRNVAFIAGGAVVGGLINGAAGAGIGRGCYWRRAFQQRQRGGSRAWHRV